MKPTEKQLEFIQIMEEYLTAWYFDDIEIRFTGTTKEEASKWISNNMDDFKTAQAAIDGQDPWDWW